MTDRELAERIGENVRAARVAAGLSQEELADLTAFDQSNVSRLESGKHLPKLSTLLRVAVALGVPVESFLTPPRKK